MDDSDRRRMEREHYEKFEAIAQAVGIDNLLPLVMQAVCNRGRYDLKAKLDEDRHLNNIPLGQWDRLHPAVTQLAMLARQGWGRTRKGWALSDTVCTLKHVATYHVARASPPRVSIF